MALIKYLVLIGLLINVQACKKDSTDSTNGSNSYFFNCDVDGKKIRLVYNPDPETGISSNGVRLYGIAYTSIGIECTSSQCGSEGSYCINQSMSISGQQLGTYNPLGFILTIAEGADTYSYTFGNTSLTQTSLSATITKIDHEFSFHNNKGFLNGNFSGKVSKTKLSTVGGVIYDSVIISGAFSTPLN